MADATGGRLTVLEKVLTIMAALLALGTAFLGYRSATISDARDQAQAVVADTNNDLASLRGLPGPTVDPQAPTTVATVRRSGQLTLAAGRYADLDSSSDPQWDDGLSDIGYSYSGSSINSNSNVSMLYLGDKKADYNTCLNTTGYSREAIGTVAGAHLCVKTDENRYSAVRIVQPDSSKVTLDIVTYDPPDN